MNEESNQSWIDPELEARIVGWVLGEASAEECEELEQLIQQRPELGEFRRGLEDLHEQLQRVVEGQQESAADDWKLSAQRRNMVLEVIGDDREGGPSKLVVYVADKQQTSSRRMFFWNLSKVAAVLCLIGGVGSLLLPASQRSAFVAKQTELLGRTDDSNAAAEAKTPPLGDRPALPGPYYMSDDVEHYPPIELPASNSIPNLAKKPQSALSSIRESLAQSSAAAPQKLREMELRAGEVSAPDNLPLGVSGGVAEEAKVGGVAGVWDSRPVSEVDPTTTNGALGYSGRDNGRIDFDAYDTPGTVRMGEPMAPETAESAPAFAPADQLPPLGFRFSRSPATPSPSASPSDVSGKSAEQLDFGKEWDGVARSKRVPGVIAPDRRYIRGGQSRNLDLQLPTLEEGTVASNNRLYSGADGHFEELHSEVEGLERSNDLLEAVPNASREQLTEESVRWELEVLRSPADPEMHDDETIAIDSDGNLTDKRRGNWKFDGGEVAGRGGFGGGGDLGGSYGIGNDDDVAREASDQERSNIQGMVERFGSQLGREGNASQGDSAFRGAGQRIKVGGAEDSIAFADRLRLRVEGEQSAQRASALPALEMSPDGEKRKSIAGTMQPMEPAEAPLYRRTPPTGTKEVGNMRGLKQQLVDEIAAAPQTYTERGRNWLRKGTNGPVIVLDGKLLKDGVPRGGDEFRSLENFSYLMPNAPATGSNASKKKNLAHAGLQEKSAHEAAFSTFSLHVSDVSFKLARAALAQGTWPEAERIRIEEFVNAFDYGDPMPSRNEKVACAMEQMIHPFLQQRNLLRVSLRTAAAGRSSSTPLRLTFLLDNSGSMERFDRQQTLRRAFALLAEQLNPNDQVTLISFARQPRLLADKVSGTQTRQLIQLIENLPSEGGTNFEAALQLAFEKAKEQQVEGAQNRVILLTDGAVNLGDADPNSLARMITAMRNAGIAFDAAGIGADGLNDEVLEALTRNGDGRYYLLDGPESADEGFARQIAGALRPAAKNVKVQIEFNPERVGRYKLLGFEKHRLKKEDFRNDKVDAAEMAAAEAGVAVYQFEAKPTGRGDVGSISVRFRDMSTGKMVEQRWPIPYDCNTPRASQAAPPTRIASVAALLAARLRGEPLGESVDLKTLSRLIEGLPESYRVTERVQQLQQMVQQARQLTGE